MINEIWLLPGKTETGGLSGRSGAFGISRDCRISLPAKDSITGRYPPAWFLLAPWVVRPRPSEAHARVREWGLPDTR